MGGGDTRVFLMEMKWAVSLSSLVNMSDGLSFPSTCSTSTVLSCTDSRTAFSRIWMCLMLFVVLEVSQ